MSSPIQIAFACDDGYARHVAVVMRSILSNADPESRHEFHVLSMGLSGESESRLRQVAEGSGISTLSLYQVERERLNGFPESRHTLNAYLRLLLPELLPTTSKVLYLDADLLVFSSLESVWETDLTDMIVAMATDASYLFGGAALPHFARLGLKNGERYFNSGVILINLDAWRKSDAAAHICSWIMNHHHVIKYPDQDALNVVLAGKVAEIHLRWNLQVPLIDPVKYGWGCTREMAEAVVDPAIVHFVTNRKPWLREYPLPYQDLYLRYLAETPWGEEKPQPLSLRQRSVRMARQAGNGYRWARSTVRGVLGRHPKPTESRLTAL